MRRMQQSAAFSNLGLFDDFDSGSDRNLFEQRNDIGIAHADTAMRSRRPHWHAIR